MFAFPFLTPLRILIVRSRIRQQLELVASKANIKLLTNLSTLLNLRCKTNTICRMKFSKSISTRFGTCESECILTYKNLLIFKERINANMVSRKLPSSTMEEERDGNWSLHTPRFSVLLKAASIGLANKKPKSLRFVAQPNSILSQEELD